VETAACGVNTNNTLTRLLVSRISKCRFFVISVLYFNLSPNGAYCCAFRARELLLVRSGVQVVSLGLAVSPDHVRAGDVEVPSSRRTLRHR